VAGKEHATDVRESDSEGEEEDSGSGSDSNKHKHKAGNGDGNNEILHDSSDPEHRKADIKKRK